MARSAFRTSVIALGSSFVVAVLVGCAGFGAAPLTVDQQSRRLVLESRGLEPAAVPNPLAVTREMEVAARDMIRAGRPGTPLERLQAALIDGERFLFTYEPDLTLTAAEAFARRRGNCVSFTNLFIALGRSLGLPVQAALVPSRRSSERRGGYIVDAGHVVAALVRPSRVLLFDFAAPPRGAHVGFRLLDDLEVAALYVNNKGAEALQRGKVTVAISRFELAVDLAPELPGLWGNLGVARRRSGDAEGAMAAYLRALQLERADASVRNNVAHLLDAQGRRAAGNEVLAGADMTDAGWHELIAMASRAASAGDLGRARQLYRRAARMNGTRPGPHVEMARIDLERGRLRKARRQLRRALRVDPGHGEAIALLAQVDQERR
jgi:Flp pilus assembly protein TadD